MNALELLTATYHRVTSFTFFSSLPVVFEQCDSLRPSWKPFMKVLAGNNLYVVKAAACREGVMATLDVKRDPNFKDSLAAHDHYVITDIVLLYKIDCPNANFLRALYRTGIDNIITVANMRVHDGPTPLVLGPDQVSEASDSEASDSEVDLEPEEDLEPEREATQMMSQCLDSLHQRVVRMEMAYTFHERQPPLPRGHLPQTG